MRERKTRNSLWLVVGLMCLLGVAQSAAAQNNVPARDDAAVKELLSEVRMLRQTLQTLQRMGLDNYRSQLLVDRIRASREEIRRLTDSINETRESLAKTQSTIPHFTERARMLEARAQTEVDQNKKTELEFEAKAVKESIERYKSQIEPLKEREHQLTNELNMTRAKVDELESRLDALERAIENDRRKLDANNPVQKAP